jgi:5-methylcytosine-specific restriction endonuclease McrA
MDLIAEPQMERRGGRREGAGRKRVHSRTRTCERCGEVFTDERGRNRFCSRVCVRKVRSRICAQCGTEFVLSYRQERKCCSDRCSRDRANSANTKREIPGAQCVICGSSFTPYRQRKCCSRACGLVYRTRNSGQAVAAALAAGHRTMKERAAIRRQALEAQRQLLRLERESRRAQLVERQRLRYTQPVTCLACGTVFTRQDRARAKKYCSLACCRKASKKNGKKTRCNGKHTSRARRKGLPRSYSIRPWQVYKRDKWTCQLCGQRISPKLLGTNDPMGPSIDHIVPLCNPLSPGHVWTNVQSAHRVCNNRKGTKTVGQLRIC